VTLPRLLLVGRRQGALAAAASLGAEIFVIDGAPVSPALARRVRGFAQVDLEDFDAVVAAARRLTAHPSAVVALVERAVLPAAAIRDALGLGGAGAHRAILWRDKISMKERARAAGIPCARARAIDATTDAPSLIAELGLPLVIKPRAASGGRGNVVARTERDVARAMTPGLMAESFVQGIELSVESIVQNGHIVFENVTEYLRPGWANIVPSRLDQHTEHRVLALNHAAIDALEIDDGITHLEAFVTPDTITFGELACRPPGGSLMELIETAYGFDPWRAQLELELGRPVAPPRRATSSAGVWFLHPGEGRVVSVRGIEEARAVPGVTRVDCSVEPGQLVERRLGVGQHKGQIFVQTSARDHTAHVLETARALIHFEVA
jgi:biotin carboxylase